MDINDEQSCDKLIASLEKLIKKKIYETLDEIGIEASDYGVITNLVNVEKDTDGNIISVSTANVQVSGQDIFDIPNKTGELLEVGDSVKIYGSRKNLSNRYIGIKL